MNIERMMQAFEMPRRLSPVSAWVEHIPFGMGLVEMLSPRAVVELGVHQGDSYCAFCQAVEALGLAAQCTGIDTWEGDPQTGDYGEKVLRELRAHHDPRYGRFSRLMQCRFDEALDSFGDGSIDLLHIDGLHSYNAVRSDFFAWLPKVSRRGIVLLHDTQERQRGFGVHRLWAEVSGSHRSFEFLHGHGLGVLLVGKELPADVGAFFEWAQREPLNARRVFLALGQRLHLIRGTIHMSRQLEDQRAAIDQCTEQEPAMAEIAENIELMRKLGPLAKLRVKMAKLLAERR